MENQETTDIDSRPTESESVAEESQSSGLSDLLGEETPESSSTSEEEATDDDSVSEPAEEAEAEEDLSDYLPDEQKKEFPLDELAKYAKRYGYTLEELESDPRIQRIVKDKINSDIEIRKQLADSTAEIDEEPTREDEPAPAETHSPEQLKQATQQHFKQIEAFIEQVTDPEIASSFITELNAAYGINDKVDPKVALQATKVFSKYTANFLDTALPSFLMKPVDAQGTALIDKIIEARMPGLMDMYDRQLHADTWEQIRGANPEYANLPAYGPKTSAYGKLVKEAAASIPGFEKAYAHLPKPQRIAMKMELIAKVASGQKISPAVVKQAAETAKKQVVQSEKRKDLARSLDSGKSTQKFGKPVTGNDDIFGEGVAEFRRRDKV